MAKDMMLVRGFIQYNLPGVENGPIVPVSTIASRGDGSGDAIATVQQKVASFANELGGLTGFCPFSIFGTWTEEGVNTINARNKKDFHR
jgi:hypothetical protein